MCTCSLCIQRLQCKGLNEQLPVTYLLHAWWHIRPPQSSSIYSCLPQSLALRPMSSTLLLSSKSTVARSNDKYSCYFSFTVAGMFNTTSPVNSSQGGNNNARTTQQVETGDIITLKPNKQRTKGKKNKFACSLLWHLNFKMLLIMLNQLHKMKQYSN